MAGKQKARRQRGRLPDWPEVLVNAPPAMAAMR
jgi:hypothetical protein